MRYFKDLTTYSFFKEPDEQDSLNVGWLSRSTPFCCGDVSSEVINRLEILATMKFNQRRGVSPCEICNTIPIYSREDNLLSSSEIKVYGDNVWFSTPDLIIHYIIEHNYQPPEVFLESLMKMQSPVAQHSIQKFNSLGARYKFLSDDIADSW